MDVMTYTDACATLKDVMDRVIHDRVEVVVTRKNREAVVMMSLDGYNAIKETLHCRKALRMPAGCKPRSPSLTLTPAQNVISPFEAVLCRSGLGRLSLLAKCG